MHVKLQDSEQGKWILSMSVPGCAFVLCLCRMLTPWETVSRVCIISASYFLPLHLSIQLAQNEKLKRIEICGSHSREGNPLLSNCASITTPGGMGLVSLELYPFPGDARGLEV